MGHVNRIKGLLALHGVRDYRPLRRDRREALAELRTGYGEPLPPRYLQEIERELSRLEMVLRHVADVEAGMAEPAPIEQPVAELVRGQPGLERRDQEAALEKLTCIGRETAVVLAREVLCRNFRDRRSLAAFVALTPSPYSSGGLQHEQGISKAGNAIVRARLVQLGVALGSFPDRKRYHRMVRGPHEWQQQAEQARGDRGSRQKAARRALAVCNPGPRADRSKNAACRELTRKSKRSPREGNPVTSGVSV